MGNTTGYRRPGDWVNTVRMLVERGYSDERIAETMNEAMEDVSRGNGWWTARQIKYQRFSFNIKRTNNRRLREMRKLSDYRKQSYRIYAAAHGWGHLLPYVDPATEELVDTLELTVTKTYLAMGGKPKEEKHVLKVHLRELVPREVRILDVLADKGPLPTPLILVGLNTKTRPRSKRNGVWVDMLNDLVSGGLLQSAREKKAQAIPTVYRLTPGIRRAERTTRDDKTDRLAGTLHR